MNESTDPQPPQPSPDELPFVAPCRRLEKLAPLHWIVLGWQDFCRAPMPSLGFGLILVLCSYFVTYFAWAFGNLGFFLALLSGFILLGPILAMAFYEISHQLQSQQRPTFSSALKASMTHVGDQMVFVLVLVIVFLIWARAASMIHVFFPSHSGVQLSDLVLFLSVGTVVGAMFSAIVFCISAFSLPMIVACQTDTVTAIVTSVNAVLRNKFAMMLWACLVMLAVALGLATAFIGFAVTLPVIGHATWHAYQETIDASAWPTNTGGGSDHS